jgi:hypothetical protein
MKTRLLISLQGPELTQFPSWEKVTTELRTEIFELFHSKKVEIDGIVLSAQDAIICSTRGNVLMTIRQQNGWNYYPDEVSEIARSVLKKHLPNALQIVQF